MGKHKVKTRNLRKLKSFGAHLKRLRNKKGFTQLDLAVRSGISENTVATIETGKLNPTIATCFDIAKGLGIEYSQLFDF